MAEVEPGPTGAREATPRLRGGFRHSLQRVGTTSHVIFIILESKEYKDKENTELRNGLMYLIKYLENGLEKYRTFLNQLNFESSVSCTRTHRNLLLVLFSFASNIRVFPASLLPGLCIRNAFA
jgi:hypothetical protein